MASKNTENQTGPSKRIRWGVGVYLLDGPHTIEEIRRLYETTQLPP